jgi:site-specific recombinase XerD
VSTRKQTLGFKLVNQGLDALSRAAYLGHANIQNTNRYARMDSRRFEGVWRD